MSRDRATALYPGKQSETPSKKKKKMQENKKETSPFMELVVEMGSEPRQSSPRILAYVTKRDLGYESPLWKNTKHEKKKKVNTKHNRLFMELCSLPLSFFRLEMVGNTQD